MDRKREFTLRMSNIGSPCDRKLWLEKNFPQDKIPFSPSTHAKFQFGDLTEEYILFLAELSGHKVEGRQDECTFHGIKGHRDGLIDGHLIDCKSASSFAFKKFKDHLTAETDAFGYITQLLGYLEAFQDDPLLIEKNRAGFLVFDKQHGHLHLDWHERNPDFDWEKFFTDKKNINAGDQIPDRAFKPKPDGYKNYKTKEFVANGNELLDTNCSYCDMKFKCYENIRIFLSSQGPKFFTKVVKTPQMPEITKKDFDEEET